MLPSRATFLHDASGLLRSRSTVPYASGEILAAGVLLPSRSTTPGACCELLPSRSTLSHDAAGLLPSRSTFPYDDGGAVPSRSTTPCASGQLLSSRSTFPWDDGGALTSRSTSPGASGELLPSRSTLCHDAAGLLPSRSTIPYDVGGVRILLPLNQPTTCTLVLARTGVSYKEALTTSTTIAYTFSWSGEPQALWRESKLVEVLVAFDKLLADPNTRGREYWWLLMGVDHKPCDLLWKWTARRVLAAGESPRAWWKEIVSSARVGLGEFLRSRPDLRDWLLSIRDHFESWLRCVIEHRCQEAVRRRRREELETRPEGKLARVYPASYPSGASTEDGEGEVIHNANDLDSLGRRVDWKQVDCDADLPTRLAPFPERSRQVVILRMRDKTWLEIAAELGITVEQAKWSLKAFENELNEIFSRKD